MPRSSTLLAVVVACLSAIVARADPPCLPTAQVTTTSSSFGRQIVVDEDSVVVSADTDDAYGPNTGVVHTLRKDDDDGWELYRRLHPQDPWPDDRFGLGGLAIDDERIAVGSWAEYVLGFWSGSVVIFESGPNGYTPGPKLLPADGWQNHRFGWSVDLRGDLLVVGAPGHDCGVVYVYRHGTDGWRHEASLAASTPPCSDLRWGRTVAIVGDCVVGGGDFAPVRTFLRDRSGWVEDDGPVDDSVRAAALDGLGDRLVVGSPGDGPGNGRAFVFRREGAAWIQEAILTPPEDERNFGSLVALDTDALIVGSAGPNGDRMLGFIYRRMDGAWVHDQTIEAPTDAVGVTGWPRSMAIRGEEAFIGDSSASTVHVFDLADHDCNGNGLRDACEIGAGASDVNSNGFPDECDCLADVFGRDDEVDQFDLLVLLNRWGASGGTADIDGDGDVGFRDLLLLIQAWGPCPFPSP